MRRLLPFALVLVSAPSALAAADPATDVCRTQVVADAQARFGAPVTDIVFSWFAVGGSDEGEIEHGQAIVRTGGCPGYHHYVIHADQYTCEITPHYGMAPLYALYVNSADGC